VSARPDAGIHRRRAILSAAVLLAALAALTGDVLHGGLARRFDWWLHQQIDAHLHDRLARGAVMALSLFGQRGIVVLPLLVLAVLAARRHGSLRPVLVAVGVLVGLAIVVLVFKASVGRVAPSSRHDAVHAGGASYPSGHAINAVVCWGLVLEFAAGLGGRAERALPVRRRRIVTVAVALAAGLSMTALDYHWFSDVLAGWLLGALILGAVLALGPLGGRKVESPVSRSDRRR
jgi:membrane-associated phospholipid phosphatase